MSTTIAHPHHRARPASRRASNPVVLPAPRFDGAVLATVLLRWLVVLTAVGLLFTIGYSVLGALRPGYDWIAQPMSALAVGPYGWAQQVNFILFGLLSLVSAVLWRRLLAPGRSAAALPAAKVAAGLALIGCGIFSQDPTADYHPGVAVPAHASLHGQLHLVFATVSITAVAATAFALAARLAVEPRWGRGWAAYSFATGLATIVLIAAFGAVGAHGGIAGLLERLATVIDTLLGILVLTRLLIQARTPVPATTAVG